MGAIVKWLESLLRRPAVFEGVQPQGLFDVELVLPLSFRPADKTADVAEAIDAVRKQLGITVVEGIRTVPILTIQTATRPKLDVSEASVK